MEHPIPLHTLSHAEVVAHFRATLEPLRRFADEKGSHTFLGVYLEGPMQASLFESPEYKAFAAELTTNGEVLDWKHCDIQESGLVDPILFHTRGELRQKAA